MKVNLKEPKKLFTIRLEENIIKDIRLLSVDLEKPISELLAEAVSDLVRKHGRSHVHNLAGCVDQCQIRHHPYNSV